MAAAIVADERCRERDVGSLSVSSRPRVGTISYYIHIYRTIQVHVKHSGYQKRYYMFPARLATVGNKITTIIMQFTYAEIVFPINRIYSRYNLLQFSVVRRVVAVHRFQLELPISFVKRRFSRLKPRNQNGVDANFKIRIIRKMTVKQILKIGQQLQRTRQSRQ